MSEPVDDTKYYPYARAEGERDIAVQRDLIAMFKVDIAEEVWRRAVKLVIWATRMSNPDPDHELVLLYDAAGQEIGCARIEGY